MPSIEDRRKPLAELRNGAPVSGAVADRPKCGDDGFLESSRDAPREAAAHSSESNSESIEQPRSPRGIKSKQSSQPRSRALILFVLWAVLIVDLQGLLWMSGVKTLALQQAVEQGAARAESRSVAATSETQIHKAIRDQRATLGFWTTMALLGDFVVEPLAPVVRALLVVTLLSAFAALAGRPIGFGLALDECAAVQGLWVLGLALQTSFVFALRTPDADASLALLLPEGTYPAVAWIAVSQASPFALLGWAALILGGWRRGQANLATSALACTIVAASETTIRIGLTLITGSAMRLMLTPGRY